MEKLVIIPTYNERENIEPILDRVLAQPHGLEVLVVDDGSPDGTGELVEARSGKDPRVHVLRRPGKMGLGSAYRDGFRYALDHGAEYIFEMDADFSHDPDSIGEFLKNAQEVDVVLGSRYLHGVTVVFPFTGLQFNSKFFSFIAHAFPFVCGGAPATNSRW